MWSKIRWLLAAVLIGGALLWLFDTFRSRSVTVPVADPATGTDVVEREMRIVTLLPKDGILAIFNPRFLTAKEGDEWYAEDELVIGVAFNGEARAYSIPYLGSREIVNDTVGGRKIAVTW